MSGGLITDTLLFRFKQKLLDVVEKLLAGKQDAGEYVTTSDLDGYAKATTYGDVRARGTSDPTYGLK